MELKELIKKRIKENVADYDLGVIESYDYLIEMIAIEYCESRSKKALIGGKFLCKSFAGKCSTQCSMCQVEENNFTNH